jgi:hypothetical protein
MNDQLPDAPGPYAGWSFRIKQPAAGGNNAQRAHSEDPPSVHRGIQRDAFKPSHSSGPLPLGSPIRGVCSSAAASASPASHAGASPPVCRPAPAAFASPGAGAAAAAASPHYQQQHPASSSASDHLTPQDQNRRGAPSQPSPSASAPAPQQQLAEPAHAAAHAAHAPTSSSGATSGGMGGVVPLDVLLAPLLPGADEAKVLARASALRAALEEQIAAAGHWEQQVRVYVLWLCLSVGLRACWSSACVLKDVDGKPTKPIS